MAEKEYIERGALLEEMQDRKYANPENYFQRGVNASVDILTTDIKHIPAADVVPRAAYEQMKWERDVAMQQLNDAGIPFCGEMGGKRDEFFDRHLGKPVGECMCKEERLISNGCDKISKEEEQ